MPDNMIVMTVSKNCSSIKTKQIMWLDKILNFLFILNYNLQNICKWNFGSKIFCSKNKRNLSKKPFGSPTIRKIGPRDFCLEKKKKKKTLYPTYFFVKFSIFIFQKRKIWFFIHVFYFDYYKTFCLINGSCINFSQF